MKKNIYILLILSSVMLPSCDNEEPAPTLLTFEFKLLNEQGKTDTSFQQNDNLVFSFLIINRSNQDIWLQSFQTAEFFKVYRADTLKNTGAMTKIGKPYTGVFCNFRLGGYRIPANDTLKIERPWIIDSKSQNDYQNMIICGYGENEPLGRGAYYTGFVSSFNFLKNGKEYNTEIKRFELEFKIQ